jgi:hypothetical protein
MIVSAEYSTTGSAIMQGPDFWSMLSIRTMTSVEVDNTVNAEHIPHDLPYPVIIDSSCLPGPQIGAWGTVTSIEIEIQSSVATQETTWGRVKSLYRR